MRYVLTLIIVALLVACSGENGVSGITEDTSFCKTEAKYYLVDMQNNVSVWYPEGRDTSNIPCTIVAEFPKIDLNSPEAVEATKMIRKIDLIQFQTTCNGEVPEDPFAELFDDCLNRYYKDTFCAGCNTSYIESRLDRMTKVLETWNCNGTSGYKCNLEACEYARHN
jgi:hypothetical protein